MKEKIRKRLQTSLKVSNLIIPFCITLLVVIICVACSVQAGTKLNKTNAQYNVEKESMQNKLYEQESEIDSANEDIKNKDTSIADLSARLAALSNYENQIASLSSDKSELENKNGTLEGQVSSLNSQVSSLESEVANAKAAQSSGGSKSTSGSNSGSNSKSTYGNGNSSGSSSDVTVYITDTGKKYHTSNCQYLRQSKHAISKSSAKAQGYTACSKCHPG